MKLSGREKTLFALVIATVVVNLILTYLLSSLTYIVHGDLYRYGLHYSLQWAETYYFYYWLAMYSILVSIILSAVSMLLLILYVANRSQSALSSIAILLLVVAFLGFLSIYSSTIVDNVVNSELYNFGLHFDYGWIYPYLLSFWFFIGLQVFSVALAILSAGWIIHTIRKTKGGPKIASSTLIVAGSTAIVLSLYYESSIAALLGLGFVLLGLITRYITSQEYVKKELLVSLAISNYCNIERVFKEVGVVQKAIYLPTKYLTDVDSNIVFLTKNINNKLPSSERVMLEDQLNVGVEKGKLLVPPGHGIVKLMEKATHANFTEVDLSFLFQNLPKAIIEDLELAGEFSIETENNRVHVDFEDSLFNEVNLYEAGKFSRILEVLGCPLSSAIACALAKATGKPIAIIRFQKVKGQKTTSVTYKLLKEYEF
jgi:hypothetical protein